MLGAMSGLTDETWRRALAVLRGSPVFGFLADRSAAWAAAGQPAQLHPGQTLFLRGDPGDAAFVVLEGEIEVRTIGRAGRELRVATLGPGSIVGEMSVLDGAPRSADVVAVRQSLLWRVPRGVVLEALRSDAEAAVGLLIEVTRRLRRTDEALERAARRSLDSQLAGELLGARNRLGVVNLTQTELARRAGFSREKVNRRLHDWAGRGWVRLDRRGVLVLDTAPLQALVA